VIGVVLMTYGSAKDAADVPAYMTRVRGGRTPSDELIEEFRRRYALIGGSPLIPITERLAARLQEALGEGFAVEAGMRFSDPTIASAVERLKERGATDFVGLILAPQYSPIIMNDYREELAATGVSFRLIEDWHTTPSFIRLLAEGVRQGLKGMPPDTHVLMTAHSLPKRVVDRETEYIDKLKETAEAVAGAAELPRERWTFCYQSAGHTPEEWLKPDMLEVLPELARAGHQHVLLAPVQFVADHLETLYDIDIGGLEQAQEAGIAHFARVPAANDSRAFAEVLAEVLRKSLAASVSKQ
jgi:ferrochelatase